MKLQVNILFHKFLLTGLLVVLIVMQLKINAQPILEIGDNYGCSNTEVLIPVTLENFEDISAFTIYIGINSSNIELVGFENINEALDVGSFVGGESIPQQFITFNWASLVPVSVESGLLCDIRILLKGNAVNLDFLDICEVVRSDLSIVENVKYLNGNVTSLNTIAPDPISQSVVENTSATIEIPNIPDYITCQWQENIDGIWVDLLDATPYSGVQTLGLFISSAKADMNNTIYRGLLTTSGCSEGSEVSELLVTLVGTIENDEQTIQLIDVYPNPVKNGYLNCKFNKNIQNAELRLINLKGEIIINKQLNDVVNGQLLTLEIENISSGTYILALFSEYELKFNFKVTVL